jgi:sec-independent protein translocase protein TatC
MTEADTGQMGFLDHLEELRKTLFWVLGIVMVATIGAWFFSDWIIDFLLRPAREAGQQTLYFSAPMEAFMLKLKASLVVGVLVGFPLILQRIYMFVLPGLLPREKRVVTPLLFATTALFYVGVTFCFVVLLPLVIRFAISFATEYMQPWLTVGSYFNMAARLCLAFGLLFELPVVVFALSWARVVHPRTLLRGWRWALVSILVVSAVLTPPDVISQVLLAGPVMLLYLASVLISMAVRRRDDRTAESTDDDGPDDDGPDDGGGGAPPPEDPPRPRAAKDTRAREDSEAGIGEQRGD